MAVKKILGPTALPVAFDSDLFRLQVYQDQWPIPWDKFIAGPLKFMAQVGGG